MDPIKVECGKGGMALIQVFNNKTEVYEMYGLCSDAKDGRFGSNTENIYGENFVKLSNNITHNDVIDFACSASATFLIMQKSAETLPSIVPGEPENRDLIHFYKKENNWVFITKADYNSADFDSGEMPKICFATRHPIKDFDKIKDELDFIPDLNEIIA